VGERCALGSLVASGFYLEGKFTTKPTQPVGVVADVQEGVKIEVLKSVIIPKAEAKVVEI